MIEIFQMRVIVTRFVSMGSPTMVEFWTLLLNAAIPTVVAALIGALVARQGRESRRRELEYWSTRIDLARKWLDLSALVSERGLPAPEDNEVLADLKEVRDYLRSSSVAAIEKSVLEFGRKSTLLRILSLPWPRSVVGWLASIVFYVYGLSGLFGILIMIPLSGSLPINLTMSGLSFVAAYVARRVAIDTALVRVLLDRERRRQMDQLRVAAAI